ncbi:UNKNOWN [Stylonychia lemnae]|uniref:Uncharacterized protein n=1 Tax=Stylonychia lemnae TaxID=5949 RepID=A0A078B5H3_STYLE|nr:UNKNOWN [Stylonychia lemnae]|eukprot:CDW89446.1 UNKNOWN [Stylonychia lemnae]
MKNNSSMIKQPPFLKRFLKMLKSQDAFGHKITLNYQNQPTFKSTFGGIVTVILRILIFGYFLSNLVTVINRSQSAIVNSLYKRDLSFDDTAFDLSRENFDMGIFISYFGKRDGNIQENIHTYFTTQIFQVFFEDDPNTWGTGSDWQQTEIELQLCDESRFLGEKRQAKLINITGNYLCPDKEFNLKLAGGTSSKSAYIIYVTVDYCNQDVLDRRYPNQNLKCKSHNESDEIMPFMNIFFSYLTQYFDHNNYSQQPIVNNIQNNYWPLNKYISNNQMMKYSKNKAITKDSWLTTNLFNDEFTYFSGRLDYTQIGTRYLDAGWSLFSVEIDMDESYVSVDRTVMTMLDAFSIVGGLMGIAFTFVQFFMERIQENLFLSSIISKIFYQTSEDRDIKIDDNYVSGTISPLFRPTTIKCSPQDSSASLSQNLSGDRNHLNESIFRFIKNLKKFKFTFKDLMKYSLRNTCCRIFLGNIGMNKKKIQKYQMYLKAKNNIENEFDIVRVMKTMRRVDLIFKTMFSQYQAFFIPILRYNVLSPNDTALKEADFNQREIQLIKKIEDDQLKIFISQLIVQSQSQKIDKRILKHLSDEFRAILDIEKKNDDFTKNNKIAKSVRITFLKRLQQSIDVNKTQAIDEEDWKI